MTGGSPRTPPSVGDALDLLPLLFARPADALAGARAVLAGAPSFHDASVAHQVIGIWQRDFGDLTTAIDHLRRARVLAVRSGSADRETDVLSTLGAALIHAGRTRQGMAALGAAVERGGGLTGARALFRRGYAWWVLGGHRESLDDLRRAIPALRRAQDTIWTARALTLRATVHLAVGAVERAEADFVAAELLWDTTDQEHDKADAVESRGLAAFRSGDLPAALHHFDEAASRYRALGTPMFVLHIRRCGVLLAAGLAREALEEADAATELLNRTGGQTTRGAELLLIAARAAIAVGEPHAAIVRAGTAVRLFSSQRRDWWQAHARLVLVQARFAAGEISGRSVRDAAAVALRLAELRAPEAVQASLLAGRTALALGADADAERHLAAAARGRARGPAFARVDGWVAQALRAAAAGRTRGVLDACRRGLDLLDEYRMTLGASELRARATAQGAELALLAQRATLAGGSPRRFLGWSERWRATVLAVPPTRPPDDPELLRDVTAFREISSRIEAARQKGSPAPALEREQRRLEKGIRDRTLRMRGAGGTDGHRFDVDLLLDELGDGWLIEIVAVDGDLHVLLCGRGRVRRFAAGRLADAAIDADHARAGLSRIAYGGSAARLPVLEAGGRRLQETLLGPAVRHLGEGPVVVVPPGRLHGVPWALLPALGTRVLSVSPSASAWLHARRIEPSPSRDRVVLVRGPGLATGGAEIPPLAARYGEATVLENGTAVTSAVLAALDGSRLAHIAAHGTFRSDSPMFSSLGMDDGPLTVHDLERLRSAPYRILLSSCDSGRLQPVGANELLGLATALLPLGTAGIVASSVPVDDEAVVPLMLALHEGLRRGLSMAEALRDARLSMPGDALHRATGWSFSAIGAA
ncbi:CHAT domain-containing protein [Streptosporangium amethystogenes]|uniref:CHAT domain-containing protein n=1 Tax=Streptosporangium amethystogenes TaxID=2002 RepID=UPI001B800D1A|nr:CHAT domain-containing tetratricopeptide repeat protein [Streptosporangium amethystogenes]